MFPSYRTGYARNASESSNPNLWDGLYAAWVPILGQTGRKIKNVIGTQDGAFTSGLSPASWTRHRGLQQLDFDGVSDYSLTPTINHNIGTGDFTWVVLLEHRSNPASYTGFLSNGVFAPAMYTTVNNGNWGAWFGNGKISGNNLDFDRQYSLVMRRKSGILAFWQDGIKTPNEHSVTTSMANNIQRIGTSNTTANEMDGLIGSVLQYRRALNPNEINQLYRDPFSPFVFHRQVIGKAPSTGGFQTAWAKNSNAIIQ